MTRVLIVGGGFGGVNCAKELGGAAAVEVTLIDQRNYHLFQPLLYQVAMAGLSPADIAVPIRSLLARVRNARVVQGRVDGVDLQRRIISTDFGPLSYDYLVLACGAQHAYFGHEEWEQHAPGLKTIEQATEIRRRVLTAFEQAEREADRARQRALLTFVVVGGGPTGVELAGAIGEMSRYTLARDFRRIDPKRTRVILIEAGPRILPSFSVNLADRAARDLEELGVQVWTSRPVTGVDLQGVTAGEKRIVAATVLWAAGVRPSEVGRTLGTPLDKSGRVIVDAYLNVPDHREAFVIGDLACATTDGGFPLPGVAPVALQQGRYVAATILRDLAERPRTPFRYVDKGQMATTGRGRAIAQLWHLELKGYVAWLAWLLVHIYYLSGFRNRVFVLLNWTWSYVNFRRGARLIVDKHWRSYPDASR